MAASDDARIRRMYRGDCAWALVALIVLWITILFVFIQVAKGSSDEKVTLALAIGAGTVLLFNTASIIALLRHYTADKVHLYGLDLFYLDEMRAARKGNSDVKK